MEVGSDASAEGASSLALGQGGVEVYLELLEQGLLEAGHTVHRLSSAQLIERGPRELDVIHAHHVERAEALYEVGRAVVVQSVHDLRLVCPGSNRLLRDGATPVLEAEMAHLMTDQPELRPHQRQQVLDAVRHRVVRRLVFENLRQQEVSRWREQRRAA